jgi:hypothetical protein
VAPPRPQPPRPVPWFMDASIESGIIIVSALAVVFAIAATAAILLYGRKDAIKYASPIFLFIINIGAARTRLAAPALRRHQ